LFGVTVLGGPREGSTNLIDELTTDVPDGIVDLIADSAYEADPLRRSIANDLDARAQVKQNLAVATNASSSTGCPTMSVT